MNKYDTVLHLFAAIIRVNSKLKIRKPLEFYFILAFYAAARGLLCELFGSEGGFRKLRNTGTSIFALIMTIFRMTIVRNGD
jgi:hypothetical protein